MKSIFNFILEIKSFIHRFILCFFSFQCFVSQLNRFKRSFKNFFKASFLSLVIIGLILGLLTQMDQAFTMMVDLVENNNSRLSLFLSFLFINALAIVLSHYPIYTYYAANLNNSEDFTIWKKVHPFNFWPLKKYPAFIYRVRKDSKYKPDNWANYLRYSIGILIHAVWIYFIINSFEPNLIFENFPLSTLKNIIYALLLLPLILYIYLKRNFSKYERNNDETKLKVYYKRLGISYFIFGLLSFILLVVTIFVANFSPGGLIIILITSYVLMFNYVFFRLLRTRASRVQQELQSPLLFPVSLFIGLINYFEKSEYYLQLFNANFIISIILLVYSTIASIKGWNLSNGIPILLAFFYFYYFIIASLGKYFFVTKKMDLFSTRRYKIIFSLIAVFIVLLVITRIGAFENRTHELDVVENFKPELTEDQFWTTLEAKQTENLFFIASHGGGLKANVRTLNVLNTLQRETQGRLLDQTVALSGASGGSLGLALYTGLYREKALDFNTIQTKIDSISRDNYTSIDLSFTFGIDTYRKFWPLNQRFSLKDRPYYAMRKYQNHVEDQKNILLSSVSFRDYWKEAYQKTGYYPSLIMNTAGTKGSRGILWSVKPNDFEAIFPFSENLATLGNNKTLSFYQAVSTTNRFPIFSPAAKIPGFGHYIDAGAIDNSGLLGCLDVHNYMLRSKKLFSKTRVSYIEIINSKSLYVNYLFNEFKKEENLDHIDKNEFETDNIVADIQTGLNLDKIPGYLSDYLTNWAQKQPDRVNYFQLFMPHKVNISDVESFLGGEIADEIIIEKLQSFLARENNLILTLTEKPEKSFFDPWGFYEPTLSRHLSESSLNYVKAILQHPMLRKQMTEIQSLTNTNTPTP